VGRDSAGAAVGGVHGFAPSLTSFVGRAKAVGEVAGLLGECRLVTVTGPGGVGKTRLAGEVARRVAGRFADGVWLVELAGVGEPDQVPAAAAAVLGVRQAPGTSLLESLIVVLAGRQLLLVLDNCEHLLAAVASLCGALLPAADDVRVLATSREPVGVGGEVRYRLAPLELPAAGEQAEVGGSEAVVLFTDRARRADREFSLDGERWPVVAQIVARLDGMPLAIELAAARVEALGVDQLLGRLDDRFAVLSGSDRLAPERQRSLAATVEWSYQLLGEQERRVFRLVSVFPGPFTLEAAEAVAGGGTEPAVLRLVDCSLLIPPRTGPDGRARYLVLETLRAYAADRLAEAGEQPGASAALAGHVLQVAERAAAGMRVSGGEAAAARWLDAEDAALQQGLAWAVEHDPPAVLRLSLALAPWWWLRGRGAAGYTLLRHAMEHATPGDDAWCAGQLWLGQLAHDTCDFAAAVAHFTAARDARSAGGPSPLLADALAGRSGALRNVGRVPEAAADARRALALAVELGYPAGQVMALAELSWGASYAGAAEEALQWAVQAQRIDAVGIPDRVARERDLALATALMETGQAGAAEARCAEGLAQTRAEGDLLDEAEYLWLLAELCLRTGRMRDAGAHLQASVQVAAQTGDRLRVLDCLGTGGSVCAATGHWAEAVTLWAAYEAHRSDLGLPALQDARRQESLRQASQALGPEKTQAARQRGTAMTLATAAEFASVVTAPQPPGSPEPPGLGQLSAREQELVTLVAGGATDAQIAERLYIAVSTVRSHLDRIRDKTGCRRRADLTRLALQAGLV